MSWDSVPWFIGGGAQHSPEVARLLAYAATSGAEGIVEPGDLKVAALSVPGGSVTIAPGAALIRNRATGGAQQTYVARNPIQDSVKIAATGGSKRSDLIVAQIEDPFMAGEPWQDPKDPTVGPYVFTRVIPNVPAGTTSLQAVPEYSGRSAVVLARVDLPASTGTVTAAMVTDLRNVARPREHREVFMTGLVGDHIAKSTAWTPWNVYSPQVFIPEWATHLSLLTTLTGALIWETYVDGEVKNALGTLIGAAQTFDMDNPSGPTRHAFTLLGGGVIPPALRGTYQTVTMQTKMSRGTINMTRGSQVVHDVYFSERAV